MAMATNADQRKWRQIRISAVSHIPGLVHDDLKLAAVRVVAGRQLQVSTDRPVNKEMSHKRAPSQETGKEPSRKGA